MREHATEGNPSTVIAGQRAEIIIGPAGPMRHTALEATNVHPSEEETSTPQEANRDDHVAQPGDDRYVLVHVGIAAGLRGTGATTWAQWVTRRSACARHSQGA